ncbi:hypothetical protein [Kocuria sp.]|uniref:hypothetical protein n=1 Tax=Kocuria sp. TaxID=1871328 RepID=UPI0026DDC35D|nr:hypothetical protein [Kocuria sp.]MDO4918175.1 hypothetical protein [Kocuria sp.]
MSPAASAAPPGAHPWAVSAAVQEHLAALSRRYDDAAERLTALAARCSDPALVRAEWTGPGSRAYRARLERHGADIREEVERCRDTAQCLRWGGAALAERVAAVESAVDLGGPLTAALGAVLGPGLLGSAPVGRAPVPGPLPAGGAW